MDDHRSRQPAILRPLRLPLTTLGRWAGRLFAAARNGHRCDERWGQILGTLAGAVVMVDRAGRITRVNAATEHLLGAERALVGAPLAAMWGKAPDGLAPAGAAPSMIERLLSEGGALYDVEWTLRRQPDSEVIVSVNATALTDAGGAVTGAILAMTDITEHVRAEQSLRATARELEARVEARTQELRAANARLQDEASRLQQVLDVLPAGILITDAAGQPVMSNAAGTAALNLSTRSDEGLTASATGVRRMDGTPIGPEDQPWVRAARESEVVVGEQLLLHDQLTGQERSVLVTSAPLSDPLGVVTGAVAAIQDITALTEAQQALRQANRTLEAVFQASPLAIIVASADMQVEFWNPAAERLFGWSAPEVVGGPHPLLSRLTPEEKREMFSAARRGEAFDGKEVRRPTKSGALVDVALYSAPVRNAAGEVTSLLAMFADIRERKRAEAERIEAEAERERLRTEALDRAREVETLLAFTGALNAADTEEHMVRTVAEFATMLCDAERPGICLVAGERLVLHRPSEDGAWSEITYTPPATGSIVSHVLKTGRPYRCNDLASDPITDRAADAALGLRTQLSVPIVAAEGSVLGVLTFFNRRHGRPFTERDEAVLMAMAAQVAAALERARSRQELARTAETLREREERFRSLVQHSSDLIVVQDAQGVITYVSPSVGHLLGYAPEEIVGRPGREMVHPADIEPGTRAFTRVCRVPGLHPPMEYRVRHADGSWRQVEGRMTNLLAEPGVCGIVQNVRDITDRKRAEEARAQLALIVESSDDAIIGTNDEGMVVSWNPAAERIYGLPATAAIGASLAGIVYTDQPGVLGQILELVRGGEDAEPMELTHTGADGERIVASVAVSAIRDGAGTVVGASVIARDITEQRRLAGRLAQAEQLSAIGELAAGMAHEINNPLAAVAGTAELALRRPLPDDLREDLAAIHREVGRAGEIVRALLRFSRHREPSFEVASLAEVVEDALALRADRLARHGIAVTRELAPVPDMRIDRDQLLQSLLNLINNAVDAMKGSHDPRLDVRLGQAPAGIEVVIQDSGPGIPPEVLKRIFHPFFTTKAPNEGTGLGLSITQRIVADHGGALAVANAPEGGARFTLTFPISAMDTSDQAETSRGHVLIVDPDTMAAEMLAEAVQLLGYEATILDPADVNDEGTWTDGSATSAVFMAPEIAPFLDERLAAIAPRARRVATSPPREPTPRRWDAVLPREFRLSEIEAALGDVAA